MERQVEAGAHGREVAAGERFRFGENWARFLERLDEGRIRRAEESLQAMLEVKDLGGVRFLDAGSGSGLFSLAARRLGARVHSFDYDPSSVGCTQELKRRYFDGDDGWVVEQASVLDGEYLGKLGKFDVVYSWGVLHHTGAMWEALENAGRLVERGGRLFIAIYNQQGTPSRRWLKVKQAYNRLPRGLRFLVLWPAAAHLWWRPMVKGLLKGRPTEMWRNYSSLRGMDPWRDMVDWVGGLPFEVATPEEIFEFYKARGFRLEKLVTAGGSLGCNDFVFQRTE